MATGYDYGRYGSWKASAEAPRRRFRPPNRYLRFLKQIDRSKPVVELGCGDGTFVRVLREAGFANVVGVDRCVEYAGREGVEVGEASEFIARAEDGVLGAVLAFDVFEHIEQGDLRQILAICREKLASDGQLVFRVPNMASSLALLNQNGDMSHVSTFNEVSVRQLAFEAGFEVVGIHPEPFAYPRSISACIGLLCWPLYKGLKRSAFAAFGQYPKVFTPNMVCILRRA